jgi:hypothetical protein
MTTTAERLISINEQIEAAAATVEADPGASPVLGAVVRELAHKAQKTVDSLPGAGPLVLRLSIVEVEQAADSAKVAAEVDLGASDSTRQAVVNAHLAICILKAKMTGRSQGFRSTGVPIKASGRPAQNVPVNPLGWDIRHLQGAYVCVYEIRPRGTTPPTSHPKARRDLTSA